MSLNQTTHQSLHRFFVEHAWRSGPVRNGSRDRLRLRSLVFAFVSGLLGVVLAGCGSSVTYDCKNNVCTAAESTAQLQLSAAAYAVGAGAVPVKLVVTRSGRGECAVSVHFATSDGTGIAGVDYTAQAGTLRWEAGDNTARIVEVALKNQALRRSSRSFALSLSSPSEGATLGEQKSATVTVAGDDQPTPR